jgi:hypothetical protein
MVTGDRRGELCGIRWRHFELNNGVVRRVELRCFGGQYVDLGVVSVPLVFQQLVDVETDGCGGFDGFDGLVRPAFTD